MRPDKRRGPDGTLRPPRRQDEVLPVWGHVLRACVVVEHPPVPADTTAPGLDEDDDRCFLSPPTTKKTPLTPLSPSLTRETFILKSKKEDMCLARKRIKSDPRFTSEFWFDQ